MDPLYWSSFTLPSRRNNSYLGIHLRTSDIVIFKNLHLVWMNHEISCNSVASFYTFSLLFPLAVVGTCIIMIIIIITLRPIPKKRKLFSLRATISWNNCSFETCTYDTKYSLPYAHLFLRCFSVSFRFSFSFSFCFL